MIVDIHAHYYPETYLALLQEHGYPAGTVYSNADAALPDETGARTYKVHDRAFTDVDLRIAAMDAQGIDVHALSLPPPYVFARSPTLLAQIARTFNDAASAAHRAYPDRLVGLATLPVHDPAAAVQELERAAKLPGVRGVGLGTRFVERDLSDPAFFPLYERIAALELPVFLHYAPLTVIGMEDRLTRYHLSNIIGNTTETAIAAAHLIFGGVLDAFPSLEIILPHSGGVFPILVGRLSTMAAGVPFGRKVPNQDVATKSRTPDSIIVGISGESGDRRREVTASPWSRPALTSGKPVAKLGKLTCTSFVTTAPRPCGAPL